MKQVRWSRVYPKDWQQEFGDESDAMNEASGVRLRDAADILLHCLALRIVGLRVFISLISAWLIIGFLNIVAKEVQWPAGALPVSSGLVAARGRCGWIKSWLLLYLAVPISSLYFYQNLSQSF